MTDCRLVFDRQGRRYLPTRDCRPGRRCRLTMDCRPASGYRRTGCLRSVHPRWRARRRPADRPTVRRADQKPVRRPADPRRGIRPADPRMGSHRLVAVAHCRNCRRVRPAAAAPGTGSQWCYLRLAGRRRKFADRRSFESDPQKEYRSCFHPTTRSAAAPAPGTATRGSSPPGFPARSGSKATMSRSFRRRNWGTNWGTKATTKVKTRVRTTDCRASSWRSGSPSCSRRARPGPRATQGSIVLSASS